LKFSAPPLRSLRLSGECFEANIHRRGAEIAETAQRKTETEHYAQSESYCHTTDSRAKCPLMEDEQL